MMILMLAKQNSASPYMDTAKIFKQTTRTMIKVIHAPTYSWSVSKDLLANPEMNEKELKGRQTLICSFQKPMTIEAADISAHRVIALEYQFYPTDVSGNSQEDVETPTFQPTAKPRASSTYLAQNCGIAPGRGSQVAISPSDCIFVNNSGQ